MCSKKNDLESMCSFTRLADGKDFFPDIFKFSSLSENYFLFDIQWRLQLHDIFSFLTHIIIIFDIVKKKKSKQKRNLTAYFPK